MVHTKKKKKMLQKPWSKVNFLNLPEIQEPWRKNGKFDYQKQYKDQITKKKKTQQLCMANYTIS